MNPRYLLPSFVLIPILLFGRETPETNKSAIPTNGTSSATWAKKVLQGYSLKVWLSNQMTIGIQAWDPYPVPPTGCSVGVGMEYPAGSCVEHLYGAGPWFGGLVNGVRHVDQGYNGDNGLKEFLPEEKDTARDKIWRTNSGPEIYHPNGDGYSGYYYNHGILVNRRNVDDDGDGRIDEDELDGQDNDGDWNPLSDDLGADGLPDSLEVSCTGKRYDPVTNPDPAFDNYDPFAYDSCHPVSSVYYTKSDKNKYTQNNGIPDHGEPHVDEDYGAVSDNDIYLAATDTFTSVVVPGHFPMGIKLFQKSYAWHESFGDGIIPMDYLFVNVGHNTIDSIYIGMFADFDVGPVSVSGFYRDNYACYNPDLLCGYVGNSKDSGSTPGGITLLGTSRPLTALQYVWQWQGFTQGTTDSALYGWMKGEPYGAALIKPCQSSSPDSATDTRFFYFFGPFQTMYPGDSLKMSIALVSGKDVPDMFTNAQRAQDLFNNNYVLSVNDNAAPVATTYRLMQNFPDPFNPTTTIQFSLPHESHVILKVYDLLGQEVQTLVNDTRTAGTYNVNLDGSKLSSGVYFYTLQAGEFVQTKKMLVLR